MKDALVGKNGFLVRVEEKVKKMVKFSVLSVFAGFSSFQLLL